MSALFTKKVMKIPRTDVSWTPFSLAESSLILGMMSAYYKFDGLHFDSSATVLVLEHFLQHPSFGRGWIIRVRDEVAGYVITTNGFSFEFGGAYQFVDELFIEERWRGAQVGTWTINFVEDVARSGGFKSIQLEVERKNDPARRFYEKLSFRDHGRSLLSKSVVTR